MFVHGVSPHLQRPSRCMMAFVDGENLVFRYQAMVKQGRKPRDDIVHVPDVLVWHPSFTMAAKNHEILRVTYYTSAVGDESRLSNLRAQVRGLQFDKHMASMLPCSLTPSVHKKPAKAERSKGVDIQLCVDVLSQVYRHNVHAILLMTGDGDYAPLIDEATRNGVQVFLSAFSNGLSPILRDRVDSLYELDGTVW